MESREVSFTAAEILLLNDLIKHEVPQMELWSWPPADIELSDQLLLAVEATAVSKAQDCILTLGRRDVVIINYHVSSTMREADGTAIGLHIICKVARTLRELTDQVVYTEVTDRTYKEVADATDKPDDNADDSADHDAAAGPGAAATP